MKRKYKVFISSSFADLEEHRQRLLIKTLKLGHLPAGMELFQPGEPQNLEIIEREISNSDIFVILVGARLGSALVRGEPQTYLMREYEIAQRYKLPIIPLIVDEIEYKEARDKIPSDRQDERDQQRFLDAFREAVQVREGGGRRIVGFFSYTKIDQLCDTYADALHGEVDRINAAGARGGWVSGKLYDELNARIILGESVSTNPFFQRYAKRLSSFEKLSQRTQIEAESKAAIAEYFWEQYMSRFDEKGTTHIYFESGSSVAYVSRRFIEYVKAEEWFYEHQLHARWSLRTNNLLTYLDFLLIDPPWKPMDIQLLPHGIISDDYGATYGELKSASTKPAPSKPNPQLRIADDAAREVARLRTKLSSLFTKEAGIVLMTASGIDIDPDSPFPGPHVGSYHNMLVKRCLFSLDCPKILFLDEKKWGYRFGLGYCHSVCDSGFRWDDLKTRAPLAIAIAARDRANRDKLCKSLASNGFEHQEKGEPKSQTQGAWPVVAANEVFSAHFK